MTGPRLRVIVAPDSFKGTCPATSAARALARGWASVRPKDDLVLLPQADGGEGTMDSFAIGHPGSRLHSVRSVDGPDGRPRVGHWLELPDGTAVVEVADMSGLPLMASLDAGGASSRGLGQVIRAALAHGTEQLVVGLGGSASTDGGAGALAALGARLLTATGHDVPDGGVGLLELETLDTTGLLPPPPHGVVLLHDTFAPLFGPQGAPATFGPQKGADTRLVGLLDEALRRWAVAWGPRAGVDASTPGAGAAGGLGFGLSCWGARLRPGAEVVAEMTGLPAALDAAEVVITGEGQYDATSATGKLVGHVVARAGADTRVVIVAGRVLAVPEGVDTYDLTALAGSGDSAMRRTQEWLVAAGAEAARDQPS